MIIALMGFKGSGKNTAAQRLTDDFGFTAFSFAEPVKDSCAAIFNWDRELLEGETAESREWREQVDTWWADKLDIPHFTPRFAMQHFGTDLMRRKFHDGIWLLNIERKIKDCKTPVVITDGRFANEVRMLRRLGAHIYRVKRGPDPSWLELARAANEGDANARQRLEEVHRVHESEWGWVGSQLDGSIRNNDDVATLWRRMDELMGGLGHEKTTVGDKLRAAAK